MKKILPFMVSVILGATSCTKTDTNIVLLSLYFPSTSFTEAKLVSRYIVEIYEGSDVTNSPVLRIEDRYGSFDVNSLKENAKYTCLFWADYALGQTTATYDATSLRNISLNNGKDMENAFYAMKLISTFAGLNQYDVLFKSAVAQITFIEEQTVAANTDLIVEFDQHTQFNVFNGELIGTPAKSSIIFNSSATTGMLGSLFVFAPNKGSITSFTSTSNNT